MNDFVKTFKFKVLIALLCVMLGFMVMSVYTGGTSSFFSQIVSIITLPAQRFSSSVSNSVSGFFDRFLDAGETYRQNELMREEINELRKKLVDYDKVKHENEQLRKISGIQQILPDPTFEPASVIARDPSDPFSSFTIDKGTLNDVSYLDPVITDEGLVGYVSQVGLTTAKVVTILDININIGAYSSATRDVGIVTGTVDLAIQGLCRMEYIPRDSEIEKGNIILTSGGEIYPKDIIIGTVEEVKTSASGVSVVTVIRPAAQIQTVKDVVVVTSFAGQGGGGGAS